MIITLFIRRMYYYVYIYIIPNIGFLGRIMFIIKGKYPKFRIDCRKIGDEDEVE